MFKYLFVVAFLIAATANASLISHRSCASRHFSTHGPNAAKDLQNEDRLRRILLEEDDGQKIWFNLSLPIVVPVYWHSISAEDGSGTVSEQQILESIQVLNNAYKQTKTFQFQLVNVQHLMSEEVDEVDVEDDDQVELLKSIRMGGKNALNVYTTELNEGLLGFATFPQDINEEFILDGVVVSYDALPGGAFGEFSLGGTLVHEVGHWLGLWHTFQDGCSFPNDFVADTRPQMEPSSGCPGAQITCRAYDFEPQERRTYYEQNRLLGPDPVHNYMDYSTDACLSEFTQGQIDRMRAQWYYRI